MGLKEVQIVVDNTSKTFVSGSSVSGKVKLITDKPTEIKQLALLFVGKAKVFIWTHHVIWFQDKKNDKITTGNLGLGSILDINWNAVKYQRRFRNKETFKAQNNIVQMTVNLSEGACLEQGTTEYPFSFEIPKNIPSTLISKYGNIRYELKAQCSLTGFLPVPGTSKTELKVVSPRSMYLLSAKNEQMFHARAYSINTPFKVLCFGSNKLLTVEMKLPKTAVVVGETINVDIDIDNATKVDLRSISVQLVQRTACVGIQWAYPNLRQLDAVILTKNFEGISASSKFKLSHPITVKANPVPYIETCSIIKVLHLIKVTIVPSGFHKNVTLVAPILVCWTAKDNVPEETIHQENNDAALTFGSSVVTD